MVLYDLRNTTRYDKKSIDYYLLYTSSTKRNKTRDEKAESSNDFKVPRWRVINATERQQCIKRACEIIVTVEENDYLL